jgi:hypothetical protein
MSGGSEYDQDVGYPDWLANARKSHKVTIVVDVWVLDDAYPYATERGVVMDDVLQDVVTRLGNGHLPADGVTAQHIGPWLEMYKEGIVP